MEFYKLFENIDMEESNNLNKIKLFLTENLITNISEKKIILNPIILNILTFRLSEEGEYNKKLLDIICFDFLLVEESFKIIISKLIKYFYNNYSSKFFSEIIIKIFEKKVYKKFLNIFLKKQINKYLNCIYNINLLPEKNTTILNLINETNFPELKPFFIDLFSFEKYSTEISLLKNILKISETNKLNSNYESPLINEYIIKRYGVKNIEVILHLNNKYLLCNNLYEIFYNLNGDLLQIHSKRIFNDLKKNKITMFNNVALIIDCSIKFISNTSYIVFEQTIENLIIEFSNHKFIHSLMPFFPIINNIDNCFKEFNSETNENQLELDNMNKKNFNFITQKQIELFIKNNPEVETILILSEKNFNNLFDIDKNYYPSKNVVYWQLSNCPNLLIKTRKKINSKYKLLYYTGLNGNILNFLIKLNCFPTKQKLFKLAKSLK